MKERKVGMKAYVICIVFIYTACQLLLSRTKAVKRDNFDWIVFYISGVRSLMQMSQMYGS